MNYNHGNKPVAMVNIIIHSSTSKTVSIENKLLLQDYIFIETIIFYVITMTTNIFVHGDVKFP